jgi:hypothetical protein
MSQTDISRLENLINNEKRSLQMLQQEKLSMVITQETKRRELLNSSNRALTMPNSGPVLTAILQRSIELESIFQNEKLTLEQQIANLDRNIEAKERELVVLKNRQQFLWSTSFK